MANKNVESHQEVMNPETIANLKNFLELSPEDEKLLKDLQPLISRKAPAIIDEFYAHILEFDFLKSVYKDLEVINRLKISWVEYINQLFSGDYDKGYFERRFRIGMVHEKNGLIPEWYLGAYAFLRKLLINTIAEEIPGTSEIFLPTLNALNKVLTLDMELAIKAYEETHHKAMTEAK